MIRVDWKRSAAIVVTLAGVAVALYLFCRQVFVLLLPFLLAFLLAVATRRAACALSRRTGCPPRVAAVLVTLLALLLVGLFVFVICNHLVLEAQHLLEYLIEDSRDPNGELAGFISFFQTLGERLPFLSHLREMELLKDLLGDPEAYMIGQLQEFLTGLAGRLATGAGAILRRLPGVLLFLLVTVIACFYFAVEYEAVRDTLTRLLPPWAREALPAWRGRAAAALRCYLRAYLLLFALTLGELFVGLWLLRVRSPFLLALLTALLDILPVLGVGVVLLPWALFSLATGEIARGVGLLVLYAVITVVRQIAEPHLVGKSLGLHPILMLISFYVGLGLFGVVGFLLGPALALCIKGILEWRWETKKEQSA